MTRDVPDWLTSGCDDEEPLINVKPPQIIVSFFSENSIFSKSAGLARLWVAVELLEGWKGVELIGQNWFFHSAPPRKSGVQCRASKILWCSRLWWRRNEGHLPGFSLHHYIRLSYVFWHIWNFLCIVTLYSNIVLIIVF